MILYNVRAWSWRVREFVKSSTLTEYFKVRVMKLYSVRRWATQEFYVCYPSFKPTQWSEGDVIFKAKSNEAEGVYLIKPTTTTPMFPTWMITRVCHFFLTIISTDHLNNWYNYILINLTDTRDKSDQQADYFRLTANYTL